MYSLNRRENEKRLLEIKNLLAAGDVPAKRRSDLEDELLDVIRRDAADEIAEERDETTAREFLEQIEVLNERLLETRVGKARGPVLVADYPTNAHGSRGQFPKNWHGSGAI